MFSFAGSLVGKTFCILNRTRPWAGSVSEKETHAPFSLQADPSLCSCHRVRRETAAPRRKRTAAAWFLRRRGKGFTSAVAMIPLSLVVVVVGCWTAVYLTDLLLKVSVSGLNNKKCAAQGPVYSEAFCNPSALLARPALQASEPGLGRV